MEPYEIIDLRETVDRLQQEVSSLRAALNETDCGKALLRQGVEFSRLLSVSKLIVSELDLQMVFELVVENAREIVDAELVLLPMLNEGADRYSYVAASGAGAEDVLNEGFSSHVGMCGWVLKHKRSLLFGETSTHWMDERTSWEEGQQSAVLVPLFGRKGIIGGLSALGKSGGGCFTQHDLDLLTMFANQVSIAIENAMLFKQVTLEIEERKEAEENLKESEERFRLAMLGSNDGLWDWDLSSSSVYYSPRWKSMLGYGEDELENTLETWKKLVHPEDLDRTLEMVHSLREGRSAKFEVEFRMYHKDGSLRYILSRAFLADSPAGHNMRLIGTHVDITARKESEEKLRQSEQFIRNILDTVDEGFIFIDRDYRILTANKAYCGQVGCSAENVIGRQCYEVSHKKNKPCHEDEEDCAPRRAFETGEPQTAIHRHHDTNGEMMYVETKAYPVKDSSGNVISVIETLNNITEKHLLQEERLRNQKLEAIGTLAGGIAHDFNNLLQGIFGYISMAKMMIDRKERSIAMLEQAEQALNMSVNLTAQLLTFSKGGNPVKKTVSLCTVIENSVRFALSGSSACHTIDMEDGLWPVDADEGQISQVIQNIVINADQAMPEGGSITITARNFRASGSDDPRLSEGKYVQISISDTGIGIHEKYLQKIFDPYFTTKEKGSGLGLATSYSIIKNHGGIIKVSSEVGHGTVFSIYLPASDAGTEAAASPAVPETSIKGRILVMDDEELIRNIATELLIALGHEVEVAEHGDAALDAYIRAKDSGRPFDIVILDLTIRGGMGGKETIKRLKEIDPQVRAIVSSGYSGDAALSNYLELGFKAFLKKPYDINALRDSLNAMLSEG